MLRRRHHELLMKAPSSVAPSCPEWADPGFRLYRGKGGAELFAVAEDGLYLFGSELRRSAMFFTLNSRLFRRSFLLRLLQTTGLSLALMTATAGVRAEDVVVRGANGANGENGVNPGDNGEPGGDGGPGTASAGNADPTNQANAIGGNGGKGGDLFAVGGVAGFGGAGGAATSTAATVLISGPTEADASSIAGSGGSSGFGFVAAPFSANGGQGGAATASATASTGGGDVLARALAIGGNGGGGYGIGGTGGDANASSTAITTGPGNALSDANADGGLPGQGFDIPGLPGNATARADASAAGGGKATAEAVASVSFDQFIQPVANPTSTAKTGFFVGVGVLSTAFQTTTSLSVKGLGAATATTEAIAQAGSGQTFVANVDASSISTALPDKAYATTLIGDASNVAAALLGPGEEIFGAAILDTLEGGSDFDFSYRGDLLLGVISAVDFDITINGEQLLTGHSGADTVIDLGSNFGPNIDLMISGFGAFVIGGVVSETAIPETSTWAMMLLGFGGLWFVGYQQTRAAKPQGA